MTPTEESPTHQLPQYQSQINQVRHRHPMEELRSPARAKLIDINEYLTCHLCRGYLIDATTITECLHSFCRSCILKFLQDNSHCPICDLVINTAKPNLKPDKSMQDIVYKLVPELFLREMERRRAFYRAHPHPPATAANAAFTPRLTPEQRGEDTERTIFNAKEMFSLSLEYASDDNSLIHSPVTGRHLAAAVAPRSREEHVRSARTNNGINGNCGARLEENGSLLKRYLYCPGMCRIDVLKKFVSTKYNVNYAEFYIDILYKRVPLPGHYTLIDIAYIYSWKRNAPMKFFFRISDLSLAKDNCNYYIPLPELPIALSNSNENRRKFPVLKTTKKTTNRRVKNSELVHNRADVDKSDEIIKDRLNDEEISTAVSSQNKIDVQKKDSETSKKKASETSDRDRDKAKPAKVESPQETQIKIIEPIKDVNIAEPGILDMPIIDKPQKPVKLIINVPKHLTTSVQSTVSQHTTSAIPTSCSTTPSTQNSNITTLVATKPNSTKAKLSPVKSAISLPISSSSETSIDEEKQNFLKSIELTARSNLAHIPKSPPAKNIANEMKQYKLATEIKQIKPLPAAVPTLASSTTPLQKLVLKRKQTSHLKMERQQKRNKTNHLLASSKAAKVTEYPKIAPKVESTPTIESVKKLIQNHNILKKNDSNGKSPSSTTNSALQSLFGNCNINIPSSLSITLKETTADAVTTPIKPVINHIEILKLPDSPLPTSIDYKANLTPSDIKVKTTVSEESSTKKPLDRLDVTVSTISVPTVNSSGVTTKVGMHPNLPAKVTMPVNSREIKTAPINSASGATSQRANTNNSTSTSFQKMFEEAIKKPEFTQKIHAYPVKQLKEEVVSTASEAPPISLNAPSNSTSASSKRNLMEIASQLSSKKSKVEVIAPKAATPPVSIAVPVLSQVLSTISSSTTTLPLVNANGKVAIPRLPPSWKSSPASNSAVSQTVANLHSASLGMNYTVSINQQNNNNTINAKVNSVESPKSSPKHVSSSSSVPKSKSPSISNGVTPTPAMLSQMSYADLTNGVLLLPSPKPQEGRSNCTATTSISTTTIATPKSSPNKSKPAAVPIVNGSVPVPPKVSSPRITTSTSPNLILANSLIKNSTQIESVTTTNGVAPLNLKSNTDDVLCADKVPTVSPVSQEILVVPKVSKDLPSQNTCTIKINGATNGKAKKLPSPKSSSHKKSDTSPATKISSKHKKKTANSNVSTNNHSTVSLNNQQPATAAINPNELLEKYNIQNLAQLTAGWNLGTQLMSMAPPSMAANQLAFQQAMLLKHLEIQNRQNWLNSNNPLMNEYKKYLQQTLNAAAAVQQQQQTTPTAAQAQKQILKEN